jgi:hypothetical protein
MKAIRNVVLISILTLAAAALLLIGQSMQPQRHTAVRADDSHEGCSMQTVAGSYGISTSGWIVFAGPPGPVADLGVITFDGNGSAAQTTTVSLNGAITANRSSLAGSYMVNTDCTGDISLTLPGPTGNIISASHFVIVDNAKELRLINTGAGRVLLGNAKRMPR